MFNDPGVQMRVLFVCSGNSRTGVGPVVKNQGDSLEKQGVALEYFPIIGRGQWGYMKNIKKLKRFLKDRSFDIVHAHYSLSAYVAALAGSRPLVVSLMGSDVQKGVAGLSILKLCNRMSWDAVIVKSDHMKTRIGIEAAHVIPNGVDFETFTAIDQSAAQEQVKFDPRKKHIIFVADPRRYEKNFELAERAFGLVDRQDVELNVISGVDSDRIPCYMYAADVLVLTSLWEGSPNVVKEAMACNLPVVATDVGDVSEVIGHTQGCYVTSFEPQDVAEKLKLALAFSKRTAGRDHVEHLESRVISRRIIRVYEEAVAAYN